jgi:hypothetical protein
MGYTPQDAAEHQKVANWRIATTACRSIGTPTKRPPTKRPRLQNVLSTKRPSTKRPSTKRPAYKTSLHSKRPRLHNVPPTKRPSLKTSSPTKRPRLQNVLPQNVLPFVSPQNVLSHWIFVNFYHHP